MDYENIYEHFYSKYYTKAEFLIKRFLIKRKNQKKTFGITIYEVNYYFSNDIINNHNLYKVHTPNSNPCKNLNLYQGHYTGEPRYSSHATFYQSAEFQEIQDVVRFFHEV